VGAKRRETKIFRLWNPSNQIALTCQPSIKIKGRDARCLAAAWNERGGGGDLGAWTWVAENPREDFKNPRQTIEFAREDGVKKPKKMTKTNIYRKVGKGPNWFHLGKLPMGIFPENRRGGKKKGSLREIPVTEMVKMFRRAHKI